MSDLPVGVRQHYVLPVSPDGKHLGDLTEPVVVTPSNDTPFEVLVSNTESISVASYLQDVHAALKAILNAIARPLGNDPATGRPVIQIAGSQTLGTVTTLSQVAGTDAGPVIPWLSRMNWSESLRERIT